MLEDPRTIAIAIFEELEDRFAGMEGNSAHKRWLLSQALALTTDLTEVRWLLVGQNVVGIPVPVLLVCVVLAVPAFHEFRPVRAH